MSIFWWVALGVGGAGAVALGLVNRALAREVAGLQKALRPVIAARRRRSG
jgi:hypothetical protein